MATLYHRHPIGYSNSIVIRMRTNHWSAAACARAARVEYHRALGSSLSFSCGLFSLAATSRLWSRDSWTDSSPMSNEDCLLKYCDVSSGTSIYLNLRFFFLSLDKPFCQVVPGSRQRPASSRQSPPLGGCGGLLRALPSRAGGLPT